MKCPDYILEILNRYEQNGYEAYVVGGCVRDALLGVSCHDYDVCTNALPEKTMELFEHCIPTGIKHGTVTICSKQMVEVTTFRSETDYTDHRHPKKVDFVSTIEEDLARRDFTINAMAYHPEKGLIDPFGGQMDLKNKVVRCVGDANQRFQEDALRMMRAHRFCARFHFDMDPQTRQAIDQNKETIRYVSVERIKKELDGILKADPYQIEEMVDLLEPIIPELKSCLNCEQNTQYHFCNVLHHSLYAITLLGNDDETLMYTLLMHDLGKPQAKTTDEDGNDHFKGHPEISCEISKRICKTLKLTSYQQKRIPELILYHEDWFYPNLDTIYKYRIELGWDDDELCQLLKIRRADIMAHSKKGQESIEQFNQFEILYNEKKDILPMSLKDLKINGKDVIENTSYRGKEINCILKKCLDLCFREPEKNTKEYLCQYIKNAS